MLTKMNNAATNIPPNLTKVMKSGIAQPELREPPEEVPALLDPLHEANTG
jgi:hypothetical protein